MNSRIWLVGILFLCGLLTVVAGCGREPEPPPTEPAPTQTPNIITVVVTAEPPPTPVPITVVVEVTRLVEVVPQVTDELPHAQTAGATLEPAATATPKPTVPTSEAADEHQEASAEGTPLGMSLTSQKAKIEHSPHPESFEEPVSLGEIIAPIEDSWVVLEPGDDAMFRSFDGVRVSEDGEALLDLGNFMQLFLRRDTITQRVPESLVREELDRIRVDFGETPLLQQIVLAMYLAQGGFLGEKSIESDPIALTTPNAVIIVSGTTFFLVYDPEEEITWAGNFGGTMNVADIALQEGEPLPDRELVAIPAVRNRKYWPIHEQMTPEEFTRLIDLQESPIAAANMISGPYLIDIYDPEVAVRSGPGIDFPLVGRLLEGEYVRILGRGGGWWKIECPRNMIERGTGCWVSKGPDYTAAYNTEDVPLIADLPQPPEEPTPTASDTLEAENSSAAETNTPAEQTSGDVFDCDYVGNDKFTWFTSEGGPFTGVWQSGCPASPKIEIRGCTVYWEAGNNNVRSATIGIHKKGTVGVNTIAVNLFDQYDEFSASLPEGSSSFSVPNEFVGEVTTTLIMKLDNGADDSKQTSKSLNDDNPECYSGEQIIIRGPQ